MDLDIDFEANGFGIADLLDDAANGVGDAWHNTYLGAPTTSAAWEPEKGPGVRRYGHTAFQGTSEVVALHAAYREKGSGGVRFARDVSVPSARPLPDVASTFAETLAAVASADKKTRARALLALELVAAEPFTEAESAALVRALLAVLSRLEKGELARLLVVLGNLTTGGMVAFGDSRGSGKPIAPRPGVLKELEAAGGELQKLLSNADAKVRASATAAVAFLSRGPAALATLLKAEKKSEVRASAILALAHLGDAALARDTIENKDDLVRAAAGLSVALVDGLGSASAALIAALCAAIATSDLAPTELPWLGGRLSAAAFALVERAGPNLKSSAVKALLATASRQPPEAIWQRRQFVAQAAALLFEATPVPIESRQAPPPRDPAALTTEQRAFVETISQGELGVTVGQLNSLIGGKPFPGLASFGIPMDLRTRRQFIGLDPPDILHREIETAWEGAPRRWTIEHWAEALTQRMQDAWTREQRDLSGETDRELAAVVAKLDPVDQLEVRMAWVRLTARWLSAEVGTWSSAVKADRARARSMLERIKKSELAMATAPDFVISHVLLGVALEAVEESEHLDPALEKFYADRRLAGRAQQALAKLAPERQVPFLLGVIEEHERLFETQTDHFSIYGTPDMIQQLAPLLPKYPSAELAFRAVRIAGVSSFRVQNWAHLDAVAGQAPDVARALAAVAPWRKDPPNDVQGAMKLLKEFRMP
jgi:hypothetical protein